MTDSPAPEPALPPPSPLSMALGAMLAATVGLNLLVGLGFDGVPAVAAQALAVAVLACLAPQVRGSRHVFLAVSVILTLWGLATLPEPGAVLRPALAQGSFIMAFFCALASLQHVAGRSAAIARAAAFLASQPSGRRYLALAFGAQVFALMLNYGALSLLGIMARRAAEREREPAVRALRTRRMLQASQAGFSASLCWSPLAFAPVLTTALVPGADLRSVVGHGLVSGLILVLIGWLLDRPLKHSLPVGTVVAPPDRMAARDARSLWPLAWLLTAVAVPALALDIVAGIAPARSVLGLVPLIAAVWLLVETRAADRLRDLGGRAHHYLFRDLPGFQGEIVLLSTAGFIGSAAGAMAAQGIAAAGIDLAAMPARLMLVLPLILVPVAGQLGLNPILFVSLFAQLLPSPAEMGITPVSLVVALIAGWTLTAPTSPFTASVMIVSRLGGVTPREVAWTWNGAFVLCGAVGLGLWAQLLA